MIMRNKDPLFTDPINSKVVAILAGGALDKFSIDF